MRRSAVSFWLLLWLCSSVALHADSTKILKVLPQYLDLEGRHALSPSLYERDAYQAYLRQHPEQRSALRFDVNWKAKHLSHERLLLRVDVRTSERDPTQPLVLQKMVRPARFFSTWSSVPLEGEDFGEMGRLIAWRVTLWRGDELLAEQKSFLW
jgi:hypothetical protein